MRYHKVYQVGEALQEYELDITDRQNQSVKHEKQAVVGGFENACR